MNIKLDPLSNVKFSLNEYLSFKKKHSYNYKIAKRTNKKILIFEVLDYVCQNKISFRLRS